MYHKQAQFPKSDNIKAYVIGKKSMLKIGNAPPPYQKRTELNQKPWHEPNRGFCEPTIYPLLLYTTRGKLATALTINLLCMQTGTPTHSVSKLVRTPKDQVSKEQPSTVTGECNAQCWFSQIKQAVAHLCCSKTLTVSSQTHFPVHVPYAPFPKTIKQLPKWQSSNLQQFRGGQTNGPVTWIVGGDGIQTQGRREGW